MIQIANGIWKLTFGTPEPFTPVQTQKTVCASERLAALPERGLDALPFSPSDVQFKKSRRGVTVTLPMDSREDIFGFGLQLYSCNHAGRKRHIKVNSDPKMDTGDSHAPVPFYVSSAGYGLFVDTYRYATFYMGTHATKGTSAHKKEVNQTHKEFSESALYALKRAKEQRQVIIDIPAAEGVDVYLFAGNTMEAVQRYVLFSGGGCLPPMWGLGPWYRMYGGADQNHALKMAQGFRDEHMPIEVLGVEPGWHSHSYSCTYEWSALFPQPREMLDKLHSQGYHVNLWEHAFVYPAAPIYDALAAHSGDYEVWNGLVPDMADPEAVRIFTEHHREKLVRIGVDGFKLDECDNSDFNASNWSFPDTAVFPSGMDGEQMHNAIGSLYQQMVADMYREENRRTLSQVRSSGSLAAALPFVLYSDLYNHKHFIRGMTTAPFSGLLWSPEVRGCASGNDLLRRVQTVVFSAHALLNCWRLPEPPWFQVDTEKNLAHEEMDNASFYRDECRKLFELRMALLPYLYSAFAEYHLQGVPPIRPLVMEYPNDPRTPGIGDEFFFGKDLLVCPLTLEDGTERRVYLPEGTWYDFFTGERLEGGRESTVQADWTQIPVYARDGAIVPMAKPVEYVTSDTVFDITLRCFGEREGAFTLYEDDFETWDYLEAPPLPITICRDAAGHVTVQGSEHAKKYRLDRTE